MPDGPSFLVAGLGNPGPEYEATPHNLGFRVIDRLAERNAIRVTRKENMALAGLGSIAGKAVVLAKPQTFMNLSGPSVRGLMERYGLGTNGLLVVYDELDLPFGSLRIKPKGSAAGHNGMKSVLQSVGAEEVARVRMGIHPGHPLDDSIKFLLSPFRRGQEKEVDALVDLAVDAVESILAEGVEKAMTKFNRRAQGLQQEEE